MLLEAEKKTAITHSDFDQRSPVESDDPTLGRLLSLFPDVKPAHIPIRVGLPVRAEGASESTTVVFRGRDTAIFPLKFLLYGGDAVRLRPSSGLRDTAAIVVALMPGGPKFGVAVRFLEEVPKWLRKA